jgi:hypothetical protein
MVYYPGKEDAMEPVKVPVSAEDPNKVAIVDFEDAVKVFEHDWRAEWDYKDKKEYPTSRTHLGGGEYRVIPMHHLILRPHGGLVPIHRDGNGYNNTRRNLVLAKRGDAGKKDGLGSPKLSRFKGVTFDRRTGKWKAQRSVGGKVVSLGRFDREEDAAAAYERSLKDR